MNCVFVLFFIFCTNEVSAQTVDEIVQKHVNAMGGKKLDSLKTAIMEGSLKVGTFDVPLTRYVTHNESQRFDIIGLNARGFVLITADSGWTYFPFFGMKSPEQMKQEELNAYLPSLDLQGHLYDYKSKGHTIEFTGLEEVEGQICYKLNVTLRSGIKQVEYIDTASNYVVKTIIPGYINGKKTFMENRYGNFKHVEGGYVFPFTMTLGPGKAFITKITLNKNIDPKKYTLAE